MRRGGNRLLSANTQVPEKKTKHFGEKSHLKNFGSGSLPETSIYKVIHQPHNAGLISKKNS